jgi:hypothetical protein
MSMDIRNIQYMYVRICRVCRFGLKRYLYTTKTKFLWKQCFVLWTCRWEIWGRLFTKRRKHKLPYFLNRNKTIFSIFRTNKSPGFLIFKLQNTVFPNTLSSWSKDTASANHKLSTRVSGLRIRWFLKGENLNLMSRFVSGRVNNI